MVESVVGGCEMEVGNKWIRAEDALVGSGSATVCEDMGLQDFICCPRPFTWLGDGV